MTNAPGSLAEVPGIFADQKLIESAHNALSPKQIWSIADSTARVNIWHGSIRSGKTVASLIRWMAFVAQAGRGGELVVVGRTRESIARNVFGPLQDPDIVGPMASFVSYNSGAPTAKMFGRTVHVIGASDARAENVIRGLTLVGAYVDEITLLVEQFWTQLVGRMSAKGAQLFGTTNPDGPRHWFKVQVIDRAIELGYKVYHFTRHDNTFLERENPGYFDQIAAEFTGLWYRRFIMGEWVQAEGAVYEMWDEKHHLVEPGDIPKIDRLICIALDYGDTHPTRAYAVGIGKYEIAPGYFEDRLYTLAEYAPGKGTIGQHSLGFRQFIASCEKVWGTASILAVDPAAGSFKTQMYHDGVTVRNAHNKVLPGIRVVSALLAVRRLMVSTACKELVKQIPGYMWDAKATARGETAVIKKDDDEVDAWRYAVYTGRRYWRSRIPLSPARDDAPEADDEE
jgi:PBSX family phage terminase large subunit